MGKAEGRGKDWHGHVTALTVGSEFRRMGLGKSLMDSLEEITENVYVFHSTRVNLG
jgi:N-terminal acetyltransferase B complex catalytic subunit